MDGFLDGFANGGIYEQMKRGKKRERERGMDGWMNFISRPGFIFFFLSALYSFMKQQRTLSARYLLTKVCNLAEKMKV